MELALCHQRYQQQAEWTRSIRLYLHGRLNLPKKATILETGCGTGVLLREMRDQYPEADISGLDIDPDALRLAADTAPTVPITRTDASLMPYPDACFDLVFCHFFLLWAHPLENVLREILRVLKPGGIFAAFAEPDYGARIDFPPELAHLGQMQEDSLRTRGAHTRIGRELGFHLHRVGLTAIEIGILGGQWQYPLPAQPADTEKAVLHEDLMAFKDEESEQEKQEQYLLLDAQSRTAGTRLEYVPTFYGTGRKA